VGTHGLVEISVDGLDEASAPAVIQLFDQWGSGGAVVEHILDPAAATHVKTYLLPEDSRALRQIEIGLALLGRASFASPSGELASHQPSPQPRMRFLSEADWAEAWKTGYDVLHIGRRLVVKPTWREYQAQPGELIISLDPGMAFGSGLHATTRLCLEAMEDYLHPPACVLDVGTGSGILAIGAARLGAARVLAVDTDPLAVRVARENVALNQVQPVVQVELGTAQVAGSASQTWDLIVANILAETLIELAPALALQLSPGGTLVASGVIPDKSQAVFDSLWHNGLSLVEQRTTDEWVALMAQKETAGG